MPLSLLAEEEENVSPPNVLFLVSDDLNCDLGAYGHPAVKTPNIDRLAARGTLFRNAHCQFPVCGPSRASFLTGLYPDQTRIYRNARYIRETLPNVKTLPQLFRDHGYFAARIGKIFHYNVPSHIGTGGHDDPYSWDQTFNPRGRDVEEEDRIVSFPPQIFGGSLSWFAAGGTDAEQTDGLIAEEAVEQLRRYVDEDRPFFLAVGFFRPHTPYVSPEKYFEIYPPEEIQIPGIPEGYGENLPAAALKSLLGKRERLGVDDSLARQAVQAYRASTTFVDAQVGRVLDALEENGLAEDTIVLFTSDHGYHLGQHGHWKKGTLFEHATRVPLIVAAPGQGSPGSVTDCPAEMVDFTPTLAELAGLAPPSHCAGVSLATVLDDPSARPRTSALTQLGTAGYSLRTERYRYTEWGEEGDGGAELYDHASDPEELRNLANEADRADTVAKLRKQLHRRIAEAREVPVFE